MSTSIQTPLIEEKVDLKAKLTKEEVSHQQKTHAVLLSEAIFLI